MRVVTSLAFSTFALAGCGALPSVPYEEPGQSEQVARVRVITNSDVFGDSITDNCVPAVRHKMAEAGRFGSQGGANINYPQYPAAPQSLGMPERAAPSLIQYIPAIRMGEGAYREVVTEYRVRSDVPFQIATWGASIGSLGSTHSSCPAQARVYTFEPGKDYEVLVGVGSRPNGEGGQALACMFSVLERAPLGATAITIPRRVASAAPPQTTCNP